MRQTGSSNRESLSGAAVNDKDLHERWLKFLDNNLFRYRPEGRFTPDHGFKVDAHARRLGDWAVGRVATSSGSVCLKRDGRDIAADERNAYVLYMSARSEFEVGQFGRSVPCPPGRLVLIDTATSIIHRKNAVNDTIYLSLPAPFVEQRIRDVSRFCATAIPLERGMGGLLRQTLMALADELDAIREDEFTRAVATIGELAVLAIGTRAEPSSEISFVRSSNLARAKRIIAQQLHDPDLQPAKIAAACGISLGYLHRLFRDQSETVRGFLKAERLSQARELLITGASPSVTDAALACGFTNMSSFSTAFKQAFGFSPRETVSSNLRSPHL